MEKRTARLTILIDPDKKQIFEEICAANDLTPSQVVRRLVRQYIIDNAGGRELPEWLAGRQGRRLGLLPVVFGLGPDLVRVVDGDVGIVLGLHFRRLLGDFTQDARHRPDHYHDAAERAGDGSRGRRRKVGQNGALAGGEPAGTDADTGEAENVEVLN